MKGFQHTMCQAARSIRDASYASEFLHEEDVVWRHHEAAYMTTFHLWFYHHRHLDLHYLVLFHLAQNQGSVQTTCGHNMSCSIFCFLFFLIEDFFAGNILHDTSYGRE